MAFSVYLGTIVSITGLTVFATRTTSEEVSEFGSGNSSLWRI
jgi:hypothetical protein